MAELTSMLHSVRRRCGSSALSASAPPEQWDFKFLSCRPHFLSLPAHCRSGRRSAPPALHSPLYTFISSLLTDSNRLLCKSFSVWFPHFQTLLFALSVFFLNLTHLSPLQLCGLLLLLFCFIPPPPLFPPDPSCCQLSFSTLCNMNSAGF